MSPSIQPLNVPNAQNQITITYATMASSTTAAPTAANPPPPHILIFPYPAQGHTLPLLDLTHHLSLHSIKITIITTPKNLPTLTPLLTKQPHIQTLTLPFPSHPKLPPGIENIKDIGPEKTHFVFSALTKLTEPIIQWFKSQHDPPVAIISDFFLGWTSELANRLDIPRFVFFASGAFFTCTVDYCWKNIEACKSLQVIDFVDLPRSPSLKEEHLSGLIRQYRESDPDWAVVKKVFLANSLSFGCIFNTFEALEGEYMGYMRKITGHERVYGVGPISLLGHDNMNRGNTDHGSSSHVFRWLDGCSDGSVLYICFGSQQSMKAMQMEAIALALEKSTVRFIWVVKEGTITEGEGKCSVVPDGFEERVAGRGWVIKGWAPQVMILSHRAVGGFLSHCGWNSVQEAIVAGVVILAWPMGADQYVTARLLDDMGVGVKACEGNDSVPDPVELAKVMIESISFENVPQRMRAKEWQSQALRAVVNGGSSRADLDRLIEDLYKLAK